jgi:hypothetical protein
MLSTYKQSSEWSFTRCIFLMLNALAFFVKYNYMGSKKSMKQAFFCFFSLNRFGWTFRSKFILIQSFPIKIERNFLLLKTVITFWLYNKFVTVKHLLCPRKFVWSKKNEVARLTDEDVFQSDWINVWQCSNKIHQLSHTKLW